MYVGIYVYVCMYVCMFAYLNLISASQEILLTNELPFMLSYQTLTSHAALHPQQRRYLSGDIRQTDHDHARMRIIELAVYATATIT